MMQTKEKTNSIVTHFLRPDGSLGFKVKLGKDAETGEARYEEFSFDPTKAHQACRERAEMHGWIQRISDGAALSRDPETGLPATPESKAARMKRLAAHYESGAEGWSMQRSAGGEGPDAGLIITAMCNSVAGGDIDRANFLVQGLADKKAIDRKAALRMWADTKEVAEAIAAIRAARAKGDAAALLAEIMGEEEKTEE